MEEPLDPAEVDEGPEVRQRPHVALDPEAFLEMAEDLAPLLLPFVLKKGAPGDDRVLALAVKLGQFEFERLADELLRVLDRPDVGLGIVHEGLDPDIDGIAALGLFHDRPRDERPVAVRLVQGVQGLFPVGPPLRENEVSFFPVAPFQDRVDLVARFRLGRRNGFGELLDRDDAFGLLSDIDQNVAGRDLDHASLDDLTLGDLFRAELIMVQQAVVLLGRELFLLFGFVGAFGYLGHGTRYSSREWVSIGRRCSSFRGDSPRDGVMLVSMVGKK